MVLGYQAHSAPIAMVFYDGAMFAGARGDAFIAFHGSWNRKPATGYKVVRLRFQDGKPQKFEDFVTGFLLNDGKSVFGRPAGLAVAKDGALFIGDDDNGVIYRVTATAGKASKPRSPTKCSMVHGRRLEARARRVPEVAVAR